MSAAAAGLRNNQRARLRGPLSSPGRDSSSPRTPGCRPAGRAARNRTCSRHPPRCVANPALSDLDRYLIVMDRVRHYQR